jgi:hypothetical protein
MDCDSCTLGHEERKLWSCAWVPSDERSGRGPVPPDYPHNYPDICPGYLVTLPQVIEAARASSWRRDGALGQFYSGPLTDLAKYCIDLISGEFKAVEQHYIRERSKAGGS